MPKGPQRARLELELLTTMGPALIATKGYAAPEVEPAYRRAMALCQELGDTARQFSALHGLWFFRFLRADLDAARDLAEQLQKDPADQAEAEACFHRAIEIARSQKARSLELRAATSLAGLWHRQGKADDARGLLAPVYEWFTEGLATRDLVEARSVIEALDGRSRAAVAECGAPKGATSAQPSPGSWRR